MKKTIIVITTICLLTLNSAYSETSQMSKSELCDAALEALKQVLSQSTDAANKPILTKEQCMAISDEDIKNAAKKLQKNK